MELELRSRLIWNLLNRFAKWTEAPWKVLYKVSSKQNERWATQAQRTEPLVRRASSFNDSVLFNITDQYIVSFHVVRQNQLQLIQAINELCDGSPTPSHFWKVWIDLYWMDKIKILHFYLEQISMWNTSIRKS